MCSSDLAIEAAGGSVKTALVMLRTGCSRDEAERRLAQADGFVRRAIAAGDSA